MNVYDKIIQIIGAILCLIGVAGLFLRISEDDSALAITGAIIFATGRIAHAGKVERN